MNKYGQAGGGSDTTYGLTGLPPNVFTPASKFLHSQTSYTSAISCQFCCGAIFSLIAMALWNSHNMTALLDGMTNGAEVQGETNATVQMARNGWWISLIFWCLWFCVGAGIVAIARHCVDSRNTGGLCFCAVFEGICACCSCLSCIGWLWRLIITASAAAALGTIAGKQEVCRILLTSQTPGTKLTDFQLVNNTQYNNCLQFADGLRSIFIVFAIEMGIWVCIELSILGACAGGAKFAHETKEAILDHEEGFGLTNEYY